MTTNVDISIIIPAKNGEKYLKETLTRVLSQETLGKSIEIIVIDSGSTDQSINIIKSFPEIKLIQIKAEEFGHGKTRNLGASFSKGKYLVFLNQDAWPSDRFWLINLIRPLESNPAIAGAISRHIPRRDCFLYIEREICESFTDIGQLRTKSDLLNAMNDVKDFKRKKLNDATRFSTVSCAIKREIWQEVQFVNDIPVAEDQDWAKRAIMNGYSILYEPSSIVIHSHNSKLATFFTINDVSIMVYDKILERKRNYLLSAFPILIFSIISDSFHDISYIISSNRSHTKKALSIIEAILARIIINLGRFISAIKLGLIMKSGKQQ